MRWNGTTVKHLSLAGKRANRVLVPVKTFPKVSTGTLALVVRSKGKPVVVEGVAGWRDDAP